MSPPQEKPPLKTRIAAALSSPKWWLQLGLQLAIVGAIIWGIGAFQTRHLLDVGTPAPNFELVDLNGQSHQLDHYKGKPTLLVFWATWCTNCTLEVSNLKALHNERSDIHVVSVVLGFEDPDDVRAFVRDEDIDYPVLLGTPEVAQAFHVDRFPTHYMLSATGDIENHTVGYTTELGLSLRVGD